MSSEYHQRHYYPRQPFTSSDPADGTTTPKMLPIRAPPFSLLQKGGAQRARIHLIHRLHGATICRVTHRSGQIRNMHLLLIFFCTLSFIILNSAAAEQRLRRISSGEDGGFIRRARERSWGLPSRPSTFSNFAEKRRVRELFGKRSSLAVIPPPEDNEELPDNDQYQSLEHLMAQLHRDRRARVRELFG